MCVPCDLLPSLPCLSASKVHVTAYTTFSARFQQPRRDGRKEPTGWNPGKHIYGSIFYLSINLLEQSGARKPKRNSPYLFFHKFKHGRRSRSYTDSVTKHVLWPQLFVGLAIKSTEHAVKLISSFTWLPNVSRVEEKMTQNIWTIYKSSSSPPRRIHLIPLTQCLPPDVFIRVMLPYAVCNCISGVSFHCGNFSGSCLSVQAQRSGHVLWQSLLRYVMPFHVAEASASPWLFHDFSRIEPQARIQSLGPIHHPRRFSQ